MTKETNLEDRVILDVLERLAPDPEAAREEAALAREYTELVGLLPYELEPAVPPATGWEQIRSRLVTATPSVVRFPQPREGPAAQRQPARRSWGTMAMAAALAVCLVGVGYLLARTELQQSTIDLLTADLDAAEARENLMAHDVDQFEMITRVARHIYPMRPVATAARRPMTGNVYVCGQHQQWYLNVQGLGQPPADHEYLLWFITDQGTVLGGTMTLHGREAELSASSMPVGTRGFAVTLERRDAPHDEPQGDFLLLGDEAVSL